MVCFQSDLLKIYDDAILKNLLRHIKIIFDSPLILSVIISFLYFVAVFQFIRGGEVLEYNPDEGLCFMRAFMHMKGYSLYQDIWMDPPPVLIKFLTYTFKIFGPSAIGAG